MKPTLETLDLSPEEREVARATVRAIAYVKWLNSGRPDGDHPEFWVEAEREWIEHSYVPDRSFNRRNGGDTSAWAGDLASVGCD